MPCLGLLSHLLSCPTLPCRHVYTTPKSFLSMTQLYKGLLAGKRATVTASIQRLEAGLAKLRKTQGDVDVLVEQARAIAVEVRLGGSWSAGGGAGCGQGKAHIIGTGGTCNALSTCCRSPGAAFWPSHSAQVETKLTKSNKFAEEVGVEKEKVRLQWPLQRFERSAICMP